MNLGVVIGYGVSETKEMAQNWRGADMFCVMIVIVIVTCGGVCDCINNFDFDFDFFLFPIL